MATYLSVLLPTIWYMTANTYGSALFAVTGSHLAKAVWNFDLEQTGLLMGEYDPSTPIPALARPCTDYSRSPLTRIFRYPIDRWLLHRRGKRRMGI